MKQKPVKIGNVLIDRKRAIHRVFFFIEDLVLTGSVLPGIEDFLLQYAQENGVPLVTVTGKPFHFRGVSFTLEEFLYYVDAWRVFGEYVLLIRPEVFRDHSVALHALGLWRRSRKRGTPAFAVYTPLVQKDGHRNFEADAFTRFYLFRSGQAVPPELLVQSECVSSLTVEFFPEILAVCQEETLVDFPVSEDD